MFLSEQLQCVVYHETAPQTDQQIFPNVLSAGIELFMNSRCDGLTVTVRNGALPLEPSRFSLVYTFKRSPNFLLLKAQSQRDFDVV
jgi:hypothetical protein